MVPWFAGLPRGVELSVRSGNGKQFLFVLNLSKERRSVELAPGAYTSVLDGRTHQGRIELEPMGVDIYVKGHAAEG